MSVAKPTRGQHVQHRDGTWCHFVEVDRWGYYVLLEETPSGKVTREGLFKCELKSIVTIDHAAPMKTFGKLNLTQWDVSDL
jgi:hypothetical protein